MDSRWTYPFGGAPASPEDAYALFRNMPGFDEANLNTYLATQRSHNGQRNIDPGFAVSALPIASPDERNATPANASGGWYKPLAASPNGPDDDPYQPIDPSRPRTPRYQPPPANPNDFAPDVKDYGIFREPPSGDEQMVHPEPPYPSPPICVDDPRAAVARIQNYENDARRLESLQRALPQAGSANRDRIQQDIDATRDRLDSSRDAYKADKHILNMCSV